MSINLDHALWMSNLAAAWDFLNYRGLVGLLLNILFMWAILAMFAQNANMKKGSK